MTSRQCTWGWSPRGAGAAEALRRAALTLDRRLLIVLRDGGAWAWLGGRRPLDPGRLVQALSPDLPAQAFLSIGEPGKGLHGWRFSHRQAEAALPIAARSSQSCVRYSDVALIASMFRDDLLAASLRQLYLDPLSDERDGGLVMRETLRAYFGSERNVSSAAAALG